MSNQQAVPEINVGSDRQSVEGSRILQAVIDRGLADEKQSALTDKSPFNRVSPFRQADPYSKGR